MKRDAGKPVRVDMPGVGHITNASIVADHAEQLRFKAGDITSADFKLAGKLFLIQDGGPLTQLLCKPT